jgi:hypothetical protein
MAAAAHPVAAPASSLEALMRRYLPILVIIITAASPARAQQAPFYLEPGHWTWDALRRMNAAGVAPGTSDPTVAPVTRAHARAVLRHAFEQANARNLPQLAARAQHYLDYLNAESDTNGLITRTAVRAGWSDNAAQVLAGDGYFNDEDWTGARSVAGSSAPAGAVHVEGLLRTWLSWNVIAGRLDDDWEVSVATLGLRAGVFDAWIGRRQLHYGTAHGGGTVLGTGFHDNADIVHRIYDSFDGVGIYVREPFHFPWYLRHLGPIRIEVAGGKLSRNGSIEDPYIVFGRLFGQPFTRRITLGINRGAVFGGEGNEITAGRLFGLLIGLHGGDHGEFENQIFSTIARVRPPLGPLGVELYAEVGMDDTAGAIEDAPGIIAGADIGWIPGLPALSLALEHAQFPHSCCGNPIWYRSVFFRGSWSEEGRLFAHPLGGHGREWRAHASIDLPQHGVFLNVDAFTRARGEENLFAPERQGSSRGGNASVEYRHKSGFGVRADATIERASAWDAHRAAIMLTYDFVR